MKKRYCDLCLTEITKEMDTQFGVKKKDHVGDHASVSNDRLHADLKKGGHKVCVELMVAVDGAWNGGDVCKYCVIDAVMTLDDRPREA